MFDPNSPVTSACENTNGVAVPCRPLLGLLSLVARMLNAHPVLHGCVKAIANHVLVGFQRLDQARLAGTVIANKRRERAKLDHLAIDNGLKVSDMQAL